LPLAIPRKGDTFFCGNGPFLQFWVSLLLRVFKSFILLGNFFTLKKESPMTPPNSVPKLVMAKTMWRSATTSWRWPAVIATAAFAGDFLHMITPT
jgi:hypothetical protein